MIHIINITNMIRIKKPQAYTSIFKSESAHNAALSGEQRRPLHLKHCALNTKDEVNQKCQALGIRLKRFVK